MVSLSGEVAKVQAAVAVDEGGSGGGHAGIHTAELGADVPFATRLKQVSGWVRVVGRRG